MKYNAFISYSHSADTDLAPHLQSALEKFAKPWYKLRNLNIYRDESNLEATPQLWDNIQKALDNSEYFVLLASPKSAGSIWVEKEIEYWLRSNSIDTIIIVLTEGDVSWDIQENVILNPDNNSLPKILEEKFTEAPFYVDLRESKNREELDLKFPLFRRHILKLAAQLHGVAPKDLAGEELRQHRKMIRLRNTAISALAILFVAATIAAFIAYQKQQEAQKNFELAEERRKTAQANFLIAEAQLEHNPTKAVELAIDAYHTNNDSIILNRAYQIFRDQHIYQHLKVPDTFNYPVAVQFLPGENKFVTHHKVENRAIQNDGGINDAPELILDEETKPERFVIRNLDGSIDAIHGREYLNTFLSARDEYNRSVQYEVSYDEESFSLYDKRSNRLLRKFTYTLEDASYKEGFVTPDNKKIVSVWNDGAIRIIDITTEFMSTYETGGLPRLEFGSRVGTDDYVTYDTLVTISSDGKHMIVAANNELQYWNLTNRAILGSHLANAIVDCATFSKDGNSLIYRTDEGTFNWDIESDVVQNYQEMNCGTDANIRRDSRFAIRGDWNEKLVERVADSMRPVLRSNETIDHFIELSESNRILTISEDTLRIYSNPSFVANTGEFLPPKRKIPKRDSKDEFRDIAFNGDESKLLISMIDYDDFELTYELWDAETGASICTFPPIFAMEAGDNPIISFSPDGSRLLITYDRMITVWNNPMTLEELPYFSEAKLTDDSP